MTNNSRIMRYSRRRQVSYEFHALREQGYSEDAAWATIQSDAWRAKHSWRVVTLNDYVRWQLTGEPIEHLTVRHSDEEATARQLTLDITGENE